MNRIYIFITVLIMTVMLGGCDTAAPMTDEGDVTAIVSETEVSEEHKIEPQQGTAFEDISEESTAESVFEEMIEAVTAASEQSETSEKTDMVPETEYFSEETVTESISDEMTEAVTAASEQSETSDKTHIIPETEYYSEETVTESIAEKLSVEKDGSYTTPEDVAEYIHTFGTLPKNFISKKEAKALGWDSSKGNLWDVCPGMSIGGDRFGNYEGLLPAEKDRDYTECDVNYSGGFRGAERVVFSNDGLIFYTNDHYESFTQLY